MTALLRLFKCRSGSAAVEMVLATPIMLALLFGSVELGNYFLSEHKLVKAVRDGARYAARQDFSSYNGCNGSAADVPTPGTAGSVYENTKMMVRKGSLTSTDDDLLPNWDSASLQFSVQMTCSTTAGTTTLGGIYTGNNTGTAGMAPVVVVTVRIPYTPVASGLGFNGFGMTLNATQQAAVMGL
jgi:Flp pilus assembly protein TadG